MDFGRDADLEFRSDPLTPYVLLSLERTHHVAESHVTALHLALRRHLNLIQERSANVLRTNVESLKSWAQCRVQCQLSSEDPLARYLSIRRLELPSIISTTPASASALAGRTWTELRRDAVLSAAFDKHMIARSIRHLDLPPLQPCAPLVVDIGGGPGHYAAAIMERLSTSWRCIILDNYEQAGWHAQSQIPPQQLRVKISRSWPALPQGAGLYIIASVIHNLDDTAALQLLRSCVRAATSRSQVLLIERTWDPSSLSDSSRDLDMQILFGGKERTDQELLALLKASGLHAVTKYDTDDNYRIITAKPASS